MMRDLYEFDKDDAFRFADVIGAEVFQKGKELRFRYCPYCHGGPHKDKDTFAINLDTGTWNCKRGSCGRKGNMIVLAQDFEASSLGDAGIDDYYLKRNRYRKFIRRAITPKDAAIRYMESRGISEEITKKYEITADKSNDDIIVFPFMDENDEMWFVKYRNTTFKKGETTGSKEWCEANRKPILFGMNHCNFENKTIVMTEGQIDSLSCAMAGIENAVSVPLGKNGFTWFPHCFNFISRFDELVVFGDYENGEISLLDGMKTRFRGTVKSVRPEDYRDCKDANEILQKYGPDAVRKCVENAEPIPVPRLKKFKDIQRMSLDDLDWMRTGISEIDKRCKFYFGELIILTGAAGDGKSTMASQWAAMAMDQGYPTMIYSGEMQSWSVKNWMVFQIAGKHNLNEYDGLTDEMYQKITESEMCNRVFIYDPPDEEEDDNHTQEYLIETFLTSIKQYGVRFIVIDNLMTVMDYDGTLELNDAQTVYTRKLAKIAQKHNVIILLIVHPRKSNSRTFSNDDIAGSSNIVNRAHKTIRYSRMTLGSGKSFVDLSGNAWDEETISDAPIRELTVMKDRLTGETITKGIPLYFERETKRISETQDFGWRFSWDKSDGWTDQSDLDEIPF